MKYALVIGNGEYEDNALARLCAPPIDAQYLSEVLREPEIGLFDDVITLVDMPEAYSRRVISTFFAGKKPEDLLLMYFSGHGVLDERGLLYLAAKDTLHNLLNATAISAGFITDVMDNCRSKRQVLVLDCCYSGAFMRGAKGGRQAITKATFEGEGYGRAVLTASDSTQLAFESEDQLKGEEPSLFTRYLIEGLKTGEADCNQDGRITLDEWYEYAYKQVKSQTTNQTPSKWSYKQQGELIIAQNPRPKPPQPAELPQELRQGLESPFSGIRFGVVDELAHLLTHPDIGMSLAAQVALERLKSDDSRKVSRAAHQVLAKFSAQQKTEGKVTPVKQAIQDCLPVEEIAQPEAQTEEVGVSLENEPPIEAEHQVSEPAPVHQPAIQPPQVGEVDPSKRTERSFTWVSDGEIDLPLPRKPNITIKMPETTFRRVSVGLAVLLLALLIYFFLIPKAVITGVVYYNGKPVTDDPKVQNAQVDIRVIKLGNNGGSFPITFNPTTGEYRTQKLPIGDYRISVDIYLNGKNGSLVAGDYTGSSSQERISFRTGTVSIGTTVKKVIHLLKPYNNVSSTSEDPTLPHITMATCCQEIEWEALPDASDYGIMIHYSDGTPNTPYELLSADRTYATNYILNLEPTVGNEFYSFSLDAFNKKGEWIGTYYGPDKFTLQAETGLSPGEGNYRPSVRQSQALGR